MPSEFSGWLPDVLSGNRVWKEPLVAEDLAMLFDAFEPDLDTELATLGCEMLKLTGKPLVTKASLLAGVCFPLGMYWGQSF